MDSSICDLMDVRLDGVMGVSHIDKQDACACVLALDPDIPQHQIDTEPCLHQLGEPDNHKEISKRCAADAVFLAEADPNAARRHHHMDHGDNAAVTLLDGRRRGEELLALFTPHAARSSCAVETRYASKEWTFDHRDAPAPRACAVDVACVAYNSAREDSQESTHFSQPPNHRDVVSSHMKKGLTRLSIPEMRVKAAVG